MLPRSRWKLPLGEREVGLRARLAGGEDLGEPDHRLPGLGDQHHARGLAVEPVRGRGLNSVDGTPLGHARRYARASSTSVAPRDAGARVDREPRRLVDGEQVGVLVTGREGDLDAAARRLGRARLRRGEQLACVAADHDLVARARGAARPSRARRSRAPSSSAAACRRGESGTSLSALRTYLSSRWPAASGETSNSITRSFYSTPTCPVLGGRYSSSSCFVSRSGSARIPCFRSADASSSTNPSMVKIPRRARLSRVPEERREVGVVGEGEGGVRAVAALDALERPAGEDGGRPRRRRGARRPPRRGAAATIASSTLRPLGPGGLKVDAVLVVDPVDRVDRRVRADAVAEVAEPLLRLLRLAQGVAEDEGAHPASRAPLAQAATPARISSLGGKA